LPKFCYIKNWKVTSFNIHSSYLLPYANIAPSSRFSSFLNIFR
jgi:hypothetical protein